MRRSIVSALLTLAGCAAPAALPAVGQPAPAFTALDQKGQAISLGDFRGKSAVVLYFYPKDDTPGCTAQACSLRDGQETLRAAGAVVLGVSADDVPSHAAFAAKFNLPFSLLADPERKLIDAYGVRGAVMGYAKRVTFLIDRKGVLRQIVTEVRTKDHDQQVLELLKQLS